MGSTDGKHQAGNPDAPADPPVGYCSPPREHQWRKGHCPNRAGRPGKKAAEMKRSIDLTDVEKAILAHANKVVSEEDGEPVTNLDVTLRTFRAAMFKKPELAAKLVQIYGDASKAEFEIRMSRAADLQAYKDYWGPRFEQARVLKRPLPKTLPDPDDIVIRSDLSFTFLGPVTEAEACEWKFFRQAREAFFMVAQEIIEATFCNHNYEKELARYLKLRRQFYRVNRHLPAAFKRKYPAQFPSFKPVPGCPEGRYDEPDT